MSLDSIASIVLWHLTWFTTGQATHPHYEPRPLPVLLVVGTLVIPDSDRRINSHRHQSTGRWIISLVPIPIAK